MTKDEETENLRQELTQSQKTLTSVLQLLLSWWGSNNAALGGLITEVEKIVGKSWGAWHD